ncbi:MAG TPA: hypothetical protein VIV12_26370, partial [Streptosporangiaceae bacterium]
MAKTALDGNEYLLRSRPAQVLPAVRFVVVVQGRQPQEGQPVERLLAEILEPDEERARDVFWRRLAMDLLDDPERVAYAEVGLERVAMVRDVKATRWHVGVVGVRARAEVSPFSDPAEAMRAWLEHVQALAPR